MRREPYTERGIGRVTCCRDGCENKAVYQWQCCAMGNKWMPLCEDCDLGLSEVAMGFINHPERLDRMTKYWLSRDRTRTEGAVRAVLSKPGRSKKAMVARGKAMSQR